MTSPIPTEGGKSDPQVEAFLAEVRAELVGGDVRKPHPHQDGEA